MSEFRPIDTLDDYFLQDEQEVTAGYWAGRRGDPEPGNLYSRAYWHGWRTGATDSGRRRIDNSQRNFVALVALRVHRCTTLQ